MLLLLFSGPLLPLDLPKLEHTCTSCFPACVGDKCLLSIDVTYPKVRAARQGTGQGSGWVMAVQEQWHQSPHRVPVCVHSIAVSQLPMHQKAAAAAAAACCVGGICVSVPTLPVAASLPV